MAALDSANVLDAPDLDACAREPIRTPGSIQPYGALFALDPASLVVTQAAIADSRLALCCSDPIGRTLSQLLPKEFALNLADLGDRVPAKGVVHLGRVRSGAAYHVIAHRSDGLIVVELETAINPEPGSFDEVYPHVRDFLGALQRTQTVEELCAVATREVRRITGLDRVLVYRFDALWNGAVIAEDRNDALPSYLGLRFPASDIPAQARDIYRLNRLRLIADANYTPTPITPRVNPLTGRALDLSHAVLRSVSPAHLEYMRNMGTQASMSISLLRAGQLWGLISCHSREPARVPYHVRTACDFIGQVLSIQLEAREAFLASRRRDSLRVFHTRLLASMAGADHFIEALIANEGDLINLTGAQGAAIVSAGGGCARVGSTPEIAEIVQLAAWLGLQRREDVFVTDRLASLWPGSEALKDRASGVLAISISQLHDSYVLWFRPELIQTVMWGGDPRESDGRESDGVRIHPRKSFEAWRETVRLQSAPWRLEEIQAAAELRTAIVDIVLRNAEEMAAISQRLSAINKELEAFSYSVSHDLRAPFRHIVGYAQLLKKFEGAVLTERGNRYLDTIIESALSAGTLVDDLLSYSHMGRSALLSIPIDMNALVAEAKERLSIEGGREVEWRISDLASVRGDPTMLRLVVQNLLDNALKFSRHKDPAIVEVGCQRNDAETVYFVRDNGAGFDMAYSGKLFGVFQRLHRVEEFEGTGIGLANVRRIVERHGGRVWAEGRLDHGATFFFALPKQDME